MGFGLSWASVEPSCTVCWDGIEAIAYHLIEAHAGEASDSISPTWKTYWFDRSTTGNDGEVGGDAYWCFDLLPTSSPTGAGALVRDNGGEATPLCSSVDDVVIVDTLTTDLC